MRKLRGRERAALAVALLAAASISPSSAARGRDAISPLSWLIQVRNHDGGYGATPGSESSPEMTGWAMLGLEATGRNPLDIGQTAKTPPSYLRQHASLIRSTGDLERTILALEGAGIDPRRFAGRNLVAELDKRRRRDGSYDGEVNLTAFGILALGAAGRPAPSLRSSRRWLDRTRNHDGGWGFQPRATSDADSTGAALQALAASGASRRARRRGVAYLSRDQNQDGGWPLNGQGPSNAQSTAWAIQGLIAAGVNPAMRAGGRSGFDYLKARRAGDGHYRYSKSSDQAPVWVTSYGLMAVSRQALPIAAVARAPSHWNASGGSSSSEASGAGSRGTSSGDALGAPPVADAGHSPVSVGASASAAKTNGKGHRGSKGAAGKPKPATNSSVTSAPTTPPPSSSSSSGSLPIWAYAAGAAALIAFLWAGGVWWYRSGGWVGWG